MQNDDNDDDGHEDNNNEENDQEYRKRKMAHLWSYASTSSMLTNTISYAFVVLDDICISSITIVVVVTTITFSFILPSFISYLPQELHQK